MTSTYREIAKMKTIRMHFLVIKYQLRKAIFKTG